MSSNEQEDPIDLSSQEAKEEVQKMSDIGKRMLTDKFGDEWADRALGEPSPGEAALSDEVSEQEEVTDPEHYQ